MRCEGLRSHCTSIPHIAFALLCRAMPLPRHSLHCLSSARHFFSSAIQFNTKPCLCTSNSAVPLPRIALPCFALLCRCYAALDYAAALQFKANPLLILIISQLREANAMPRQSKAVLCNTAALHLCSLHRLAFVLNCVAMPLP